jgi:predicted lipoprotein
MAVALLAACSSGLDRGDTVEAIVDDVLVPGFSAAAAATADLAAASADLCAAPGPDTLDTARQAWSEAVTAWNATEVAWEGPVKMDRIDSLVHYPAVDVEEIDRLLDGHSEGEQLDPADLASVVRGLGTAEYLLFAADDPAAVATQGRCDLLTAVTAGAAEGAAAAESAWADGWDGGAPYADVLAGRAEPAMAADDALAGLVAGIDAILSNVTVQGLGLALGETREEPLPEAVHEGAAGAAGDVLAARLAGIATAYDPPADTPGLGDLVAERSEEVDAAIRADLAAAQGALDALGSPLTPALADSPDQAAALYDALVELRRTFEADVASLLDITVGFSDTDGDSG